MKKKQENYLERKPLRRPDLRWTTDEQGAVTLELENKGFFNRIAQRLFKKPRISYIHLDEMGSFIWPLLNGEEEIAQLGPRVEAHFGQKAHPLYERLAQYIRILESYGFVIFK